MRELLKKLRRYEVRIRNAVNSQTQGNYRSLFKGSGLEFDDVRLYQYGDDVRSIDWNVSAKGHGTFVKTFREEKEQSILFLVDVSASQFIGGEQLKADVAREVCGVLALSAAKESAQVGLVSFTDRRERYIVPKKGLAHAYAIIKSLYAHAPAGLGTDITKAISFVMQMVKHRSLIILISDFVDENYVRRLKMLAHKHDLVLIQVFDRREAHLPQLGIVPVEDRESGLVRWVNTSFGGFRQLMGEQYRQRVAALGEFARKSRVSYITIDTAEDFVPKLLELFKRRNRK